MRANIVDAINGVGRPAGHVVCVFQTDEGGLRVVVDARANHRFDLRPGEDAVVTASDARHATGDGGHGGELVEIDVAALFANHFVSMMGPDLDGAEVAHAAGRN